MSITITWSTPDHRYFMRRTKNEIIRRIEELQGRQFDFSERWTRLHMTKDQLASEAMQLIRALPPPPDPVEQMVGVIMAELLRQADDPDRNDSPYVRPDEPHKPLIDGWVDLRQLAQAVLKSGIITP